MTTLDHCDAQLVIEDGRLTELTAERKQTTQGALLFGRPGRASQEGIARAEV
jgi:hypothetical protein